MQLTRQLALFLGNQPGTLARMCRALADAKINLFALSVGDTVDHCVVRVITSDWQLAKRVFEAHNALVVETEVLMIEGRNHPGTFSGDFRKAVPSKNQHRLRLLCHRAGSQTRTAHPANLPFPQSP